MNSVIGTCSICGGPVTMPNVWWSTGCPPTPRCEWCGAENGKPHPITGSRVVLTVAHVFDERPEAASLLNLAALCQRCHNRHDAPGRQQRRKARIEARAGQKLLWAENGGHG